MDRMSDEEVKAADRGITAAGWDGKNTLAARVRADWLRARSEEARLTEELKKKDAEITRLGEECASRFALAEKQEARADRLERAVKQGDETIKALADALEEERGLTGNGCVCITIPGQEYRCVSCKTEDALHLAGRLP